MLTLFAAKGSIALASALVLEEVGTPYQLHLVDVASGAQRGSEYLAVNPIGRVPALATPDGILTETGAVLEYVGTKLMTKSAFKDAKIREVVHYLASTMHVAHAHKKRGHRWADDPDALAHMTSQVPRTMAECCAYVETLIVGPYLFGDEITIADPHLFAICQWLETDQVAISDYPKLARFVEEFSGRPSVAALKTKGLL